MRPLPGNCRVSAWSGSGSMTQNGSVNGKVGSGQPDAGKPPCQTKRHRSAMPRLIAMLRPESLPLTVGAVFCIASVGLMVATPWITGDATDILFGGIISKRIPAYLTKAQAIAALRAYHQDRLARMLSAMSNITPGAGV